MWFTNSDEGTRHHNLWRLDVLNSRNTALELQVDIHHMTLTDWCDMGTRQVALLVVVLINHGDNLLL